MARDWKLSLPDERGDQVEIILTEQQARAFMARTPIAYWASAPEQVGVDPSGQLFERHDARDRHEEERRSD